MSRDSVQATQVLEGHVLSAVDPGTYNLYGAEPSYLLVDSDGDALAVHSFDPVGDQPAEVYLTAYSDLGGGNSVHLSPADLIALGEHLTDLGEEQAS